MPLNFFQQGNLNIPGLGIPVEIAVGAITGIALNEKALTWLKDNPPTIPAMKILGFETEDVDLTGIISVGVTIAVVGSGFVIGQAVAKWLFEGVQTSQGRNNFNGGNRYDNRPPHPKEGDGYSGSSGYNRQREQNNVPNTWKGAGGDVGREYNNR